VVEQGKEIGSAEWKLKGLDFSDVVEDVGNVIDFNELISREGSSFESKLY
jgi:hypothetical protein